MSIVNSLTFSVQRRDKLISLRNGFTYMANFTVLSFALIIFALVKVDEGMEIQEAQIKQFRIIGFGIIVLGIITSIIYITVTKENYLTQKAKTCEEIYKAKKAEIEYNSMTNSKFGKSDLAMKAKAKSSMSDVISNWQGWLREGNFYIHMIVYMVVRVAVNVTMSVMPFYLIYVTNFEQTEQNPTPLAVALVPLFQYTFSLLFSLFLYKPMMNWFKNRLYPLVISVIVLTVGSVPLLFLGENEKIDWIVYIASSI
mmetsp:Transcript_42415/g.31068  ORF Transcript_42415/g.31068 Transcript_42415/m.31068 type:complete len:255 (-) Transcript_42415:405-1169(-)